MKKKIISKEILKYIYVVLGCFVLSLAINVFLLPNKISTGGATGVSTILYYIYNVPMSLGILVINIPLFLISLKTIGFKFCAKALAGILLLSGFVELTRNINNLYWINIQKDFFLGSIFGGIMLGIGNTLVFKGEGSTGGTDLLAQLIYKKRTASSLGQIMLVIDVFIVMATTIAFKNLNCGLYSIVTLYLSKQTIDILFEGVNYTKVINIVTKKGNEIADDIIKKTDRGVSIDNGIVGKYTGEKYSKVICVVNRSEVYKIKNIIKEIDKNAFTYISNASEVLGTGFKNK